MQTFATADGQQIGYDLLGAGPLILTVPGGPARAAAYLGDLGGLDAKHTLVLADSRGCGASRPADPAALTMQRLAADVAELHSHLGASGPVVLLAHSFGTRIALAVAAAHPELVAALILVTPPPAEDSPEHQAAREAILDAREPDAEPAVAEAIEAARAIPFAGPRERALLEAQTIPLWYSRWDETARAHAASAATQVSIRTALTLRESARGWRLPDLAELTAPVLLIAGSADLLTPPASVHSLHEAISGSDYAELEDAGHFPWVDDPAGFAALVTDFLAGQLTDGTGDA